MINLSANKVFYKTTMIVVMSEFMFMIKFQGLLLLPSDNILDCYLQHIRVITRVRTIRTLFTPNILFFITSNNYSMVII